MAQWESGVKEVVTAVPSDVQQPEMYRHTVYILGGIGALCVVGVAVLALLGKQVDAGLIAIGASAVGGLVTLLAPRAK